MEQYKLRLFARWADKSRISDSILRQVVNEMQQGLLGDRLGANIYKKRVAQVGRGKRGGARAIILFKQGEVAVFLYGYSKNQKSDLTSEEEDALRIFAKGFMRLTPSGRLGRVTSGALIRLRESPHET